MPELKRNEDFITYNIKAEDLFDEFETRPIQNGILMVLGKLRGQSQDAFQTQSFQFSLPDWTESHVLDWIKLHADTYKFTMEDKKDNAQLGSIKGVEIFAAGTWNGDAYTIEDLDSMVDAFEKTKNKIKPYLKLGHDPDQKLVQNDGLPAAGWIGKVYRKGTKLMADFVEIPKKIHELIKNKAYRKVSSEIYWNLNIDGKVYEKVLSGASLLGSDLPAVTSLDDILGLYGLKDYETLKTYVKEHDENEEVKTYEYEPNNKEQGEEEMPKTKQEELEAKIKELEGKNTELSASNKDLGEKVEKTEKEYSQLAKAKADVELEKTLGEMKITPGMKPYVKALLQPGEKKEYSFGEGDKEKKFSRSGLLKEILKLNSKSDVNLEEGSEDIKAQDKDSVKAMDAKINEYAKENEVSYSQAYKEVMRDQEQSNQDEGEE